MSTLRCTNLQDTSGGNSLTTAQIYNGAAKAWVNFNGTGTVAIRAQFNVSSITDNGVGLYTVNFSSVLVDGDYSAVVVGGNNTANAVAEGSSTHSQTSGSCGINMSNVATSPIALVDRALICVAIFR
jgi:hypothetical protein